MDLHKCLLTENDCYKAGRKIVPKGVMVHSTGANNPNLRRYVGPDDGLLGQNPNSNHWNMSGVGACVHAFIGRLADGSVATYQTLPWTARGWHCGSGRKGISANNTHISFEICEDGLKDRDYFDLVYREAVELPAYLCREYGLEPAAEKPAMPELLAEAVELNLTDGSRPRDLMTREEGAIMARAAAKAR